MKAFLFSQFSFSSSFSSSLFNFAGFEDEDEGEDEGRK